MLFLRQCALCVSVFIALAGTANGQTGNPISGSAQIAHWSFLLEDVVQIPNSVDGTPRLEFLTGNPANGLAYVIDQHGPIYSFDPNEANPTASLFLDPDSAVGNLTDGNESGVRGLAFHPDFDNVGTAGYRKMYTALSRNSSSDVVGNPVIFGSPGGTNHFGVIGEWTVNANGTVNLNSYRELLRIRQPFSNHNSGHIGFNPTASSSSSDYGKLYIAVGDGGSSGGPFDLSLDIDATPVPYPHGKILRIDPIASGGDPYTIPGDNPFAGQNNRIEEAWAYGLRNPHKFAWDRATGEMYISDIGQGVVEEISVGHSNANYGWNDREGAYVYTNTGSVSPLPVDHASDSFTYPVAQYDHIGSNGISGSSAVVGGSVYRGNDVPELTGMYLFADFATNPGPIFAVDVDNLIERNDFTNITNLDNGRLSPYVEVEIRDVVDKDFRQFLRDANNNQSYTRTDTRWGAGPDGELYILNKRDGMVRRIAGVVGLTLGDANRDANVDGLDLDRWETSFGLSGDWSDANFDAGPVIDGGGFILWQRKFDGLGSLQVVPEPCALILMTLAFVSSTSLRARPLRHRSEP